MTTTRAARLDFETVLKDLLAQDAPRGWVTLLAGDQWGEIAGWFLSPRNAASWVTSQEPERLDTPYEYVLRPLGPDEEIGCVMPTPESNPKQRMPDAVFTATARTAVPALLAAVEAVEALGQDLDLFARLERLCIDGAGNPSTLADAVQDEMAAAIRSAIATAIGGAR